MRGTILNRVWALVIIIRTCSCEPSEACLLQAGNLEP